jgi:hypothetical protein
MKQFRISVLLIITSVLLCACPEEEGHHYIKLLNKSDISIGCQMFWSGNIMNADTIFQCNMATDFIVPADSFHIFESTMRTSNWEDDFKVIPYIQFLIMDGTLFKQYFSASCDTIRKYVPILHTYRLTLEDLQRMNWTVVYPPEE